MRRSAQRLFGPSPARWARIACLAGLAAGVATASLRKLADPDLPWHMAVGRAVITTGAFPTTDGFSYTFPGKPIPYEYLSDILLYLTQRVSPSFGPAFLLACCLALLLLLMRARAKRDSGPAGWFVLAAALIALGPWLLVRPATLGFPLLAAELLLVERHRRGGGRRELLALIPLQTLWANVHGFAVLGAALIAFYSLYCGLCRLAGSRRGPLLPAAEGRDAAVVAGTAAAALAATCLSSFGPGIFLGPLRVAGHERYIAEWTPASLPLLVHADPALLLVILLTIAALLWGRGEDGRRVPNLYVLGLAGGSLLMTFLRFRLAPVFVIATAPMLAERLEPLCRSWRSAPWLAAAAGLIVPFGLAASAPAPLGIGFDPAWIPVAAGDYIEAHQPQGPVWNNLAFGGYLIWRFAPRIPVFVDGRTAYLYPNSFLEDAFKAETSTQAFASLSGKYGFEWAMTDARGTEPFGFTLAQDKRWTMVYVDDRAAIYVKTDGPNAVLAKSGYRVLRHLTTAWDLMNARPPLDALQSDVDQALKQSPQSRHVQAWAEALALLKTGPPKSAAAR
jgi:hypothetical protein